jgi:hypothetical protein
MEFILSPFPTETVLQLYLVIIHALRHNEQMAEKKVFGAKHLQGRGKFDPFFPLGG